MFHINDSGKRGKCRAKKPENCRFYNGESDSRHYETVEEAIVAEESWAKDEAERQGISTVGGLKKDSEQKNDSFHYADMDKKERTDKMVANLENAIENIVKDGKLGDYLKAMSANGANRWTFSNVALATMQLRDYNKRNGLEVDDDPLDTLRKLDACGAKQWGARGRKITSGKGSALYILAPMIGNKEAVDSNGNKVIGSDGKPVKRSYVYGFRAVPVFDVSQTDGVPVPTNPIKVSNITQEIDEKYVEDMKKLVESSGYEYSEKEIASNPEKLEGTLGYTSPSDMSVVIDSRLSPANKATVLAHELAHIKLGHVTKDGMSEYQSHRGRMETEAEGLAYMIMQKAGLDKEQGDGFSAGYIAGWSKGDMRVVRTALNKVTSTFGKIMEEVKWD